VSRAFVVRAVGATVCAAASAVVSLTTRSGGPGGYLILLAVASVAVFALGVGFRSTPIVATGIAGLASTQVFGHLRTDDAPELIAVVVLLTTAFELGCWATELVTPVDDGPGVHRARWRWVLGWGLGGGALATLVLAGATVSLRGRFPLDLLAVLAVLLVLVGVTLAAQASLGSDE
jgi:hypothetical protein